MINLNTVKEVSQRVNLAAVIDSSGRGGNLFFLTLFDLHPEIACCPLVQYSYSYILAEFGKLREIDAMVAHSFITQKSYFRMIYNELRRDDAILYERMGGDIDDNLNRESIRQIVDAYFLTNKKVTRREILAVPLVAHALVRGVDPENLKYILIGDAISKREEDVCIGFSGSIIDSIVDDFPDAKIFRLVRDPRSTFASPRHQYVNSLGNMYAIKPHNYFSRLWTLISGVLTPDNSCVYLYWLLYIKQTERAIIVKENQYSILFKVVKNEDLNLFFTKTIKEIASWLGVRVISSWESENFKPTVNGAEWRGAGAYNSRYQRVTSGLLANDPPDISRKVTGPNEYVTRRWKKRLNKQEIILIEYLFADELKKYSYDFLSPKIPYPVLDNIIFKIIGPFEGELPTIKWIKTGFSLGLREGAHRLFYSISFPPFYLVSRLKFLYLHFKGVI